MNVVKYFMKINVAKTDALVYDEYEYNMWKLI